MEVTGINLLVRVDIDEEEAKAEQETPHSSSWGRQSVKGTILAHGQDAVRFQKGTQILFNPWRAVIADVDAGTVFISIRDVLAIVGHQKS